MGTQQILMIVVGVIIVGIAVSVGFFAFNSAGYNSNKSAVATDIQDLSTKLTQFWMLPASMGGANKNIVNVTVASVGATLGFEESDGIYKKTTDNGEYRVISVNDGIVVLGGLGIASRRGKFPYVELTADLMTQDVQTELSEEAGF